MEVTPISLEEIRGPQEFDAFCKQARQDIQIGKPSLFAEDERGVLVRIACRDGVRQLVVPENLRTKVLLLAHHTHLGGHPGITLHVAKNILLAHAHGRRKALLPIVPRLREGAH